MWIFKKDFCSAFFQQKPIQTQTRDKGFSLIEVLAGVFLLAGLLSLIVQMSYGNARRMKKARQLDKIAELLEFKMLQLEEEFKGDKIYELPTQQEGSFEEEDNYFWSYQTQSLTLPSAESLVSLIQLPENELNVKMAETLRGVLSSSIVELKLTVRYEGKRGKKYSYSLVSYFINYEDAPDFIFQNLTEFLPVGGAGL